MHFADLFEKVTEAEADMLSYDQRIGSGIWRADPDEGTQARMVAWMIQQGRAVSKKSVEQAIEELEAIPGVNGKAAARELKRGMPTPESTNYDHAPTVDLGTSIKATQQETNVIGFAAGTTPLKVTEEPDGEDDTLPSPENQKKWADRIKKLSKPSRVETPDSGNADISRFLSGKDSHGQGEDVDFHAGTPRG